MTLHKFNEVVDNIKSNTAMNPDVDLCEVKCV